MRFDPESVIHGIYAAWRLQDVDATLAYCHDDIRYRVMSSDGARQLGADTVGKAAVRSYLEAVCSVWSFIEIVPGACRIEDGGIVREQMQFRAVHAPSGFVLEGRRRHVWVVEDRRVHSCTEFQDVGQLEAFLRMAEASCKAGAPSVLALLGAGQAVISVLAGLG